MRKILLLTAILASASATGFYYQESSSRSSSSSYKNNELQHQTEDESYYAKQGDTEHKTKPKVNTYSHHIQYNNPHNQDHSQTAYRPGDSDAYAARQAVGSDGVVKTVTGNRDHYSYQATYGVSGGQIQPLQAGHYDTESNLLSLTQRLQNDLSRQLQNAIATQKRTSSSYSSGSTYVESEFRHLEDELRTNLTRQLEEELRRQYGTQVSRGAHSYTVTDGRYTSQANYNTQELDDLTQQLQTNLMQQLRNQYQNTAPDTSRTSDAYYTSQQHQQHSQQSSRAHSTMYRPTYEQFPQHPEVRPSIPLNQVVTQVQATVDRKLNEALNFVEQTYLSGDVVYTSEAPNFNDILENLKQELLRNITTILQTTLMEQYGSQEEHNDYYYSTRNVAAGSMVANYRLDDLNNLKQQVENNLLQKLRNSIQRQEQTYRSNRQSYFQSQSYSSSSSRYDSSYRPSSPKVYTSYVAFTPQRGSDDTYRQTQTHSSDNTYSRHDEHANTRPGYRPVHTTVAGGPVRYDSYPSQHVTQQSASHTQDSQRTEQLEYDYSPTGTRPTTYRGTYQPSGGGGSYRTGTVYYPSGSAAYPSGSGTSYQTTNRELSHQSLSGHRETQYVPTQQDYQAELLDIKDQVQTDISRQINTAIDKQRHSGTAHSTTMTSNEVLTQLSDELKRNLTQKIEETLREHQRRTGVRGGYTVTVNTGGRIHPGSYSREQLARLTNELQEDLLRQLREGLAQESYSGQSGSYTHGGGYTGGRRSYSSYSSGSSYRTYGASGNAQGECCIQADDSTTIAQEAESGEINGKKQANRGDIHDEDGQKIEDNKSPVAIEATPPEVVETTTRKLARDRPSKRPITSSTTAKPIRRDETEQQAYQNQVDDQQLTENLDQFSQSYLDEHNLENQFAEQNQQNHQETLGAEFYQQSSDSQKLEDQSINTGSVAQQTVQSQNTESGESTQRVRQYPGRDYQPQGQHFGRTQETSQYPGRLHQLPIPPYGAGRRPQSARGNENQLTQQTEDLTQQTHHSTEDLTQQTEDLSQHSQQIDVLNQQNQFLTHEREAPERYTTHSQVATQTNGHATSQYSQHHQTQQIEDLTQQQSGDFTQQIEDLAQQLEDLTQQTQDLTQQTDDLSQQTYLSRQHLQQTEDLSQQTYLPGQHTQHTENLSQQSYLPPHHTQDLTQQTEDLTQHTQDLTQQTEDLTQHTQDLTQQTEDLTQHTQDLTHQFYLPAQHSQDLTQQTEDLTQHTQDLTQQSYLPAQHTQHTENLSQQSYLSPHHTQDLTQQTEDLTQHTQDLTQQTEDLTQHTQDLTQQTEDLTQHTQDLTQQSYLPAQHSQDLTQQTEDLTQQHVQHSGTETVEERTANLMRQLKDLVEKGETQQVERQFLYNPPRYQSEQTHQPIEDEQRNTYHQHPSRGSYGNYRSHSSHAASSSYTTSSSNNQQVQYGHVSEVPLERATDLEQQHVERQHANVVQDVSQQVQETPQTVLEDVEQVTTEKPGFWKKLGGKINKTYNKAKDSILSVG